MKTVSSYKNPISWFLRALPGGAKITIANNPGDMEVLPQGSPVEAVGGGLLNVFKLIKGVEVYETSAGTSIKIKKTNLVGVNDIIQFDVSAIITAKDSSNTLYDLITVDAASAATAGVMYSETFTKALVTSTVADINNTLNICNVGVMTHGEIKVGKMAMPAPLTTAKTGLGLSVWEDYFV